MQGALTIPSWTIPAEVLTVCTLERTGIEKLIGMEIVITPGAVDLRLMVELGHAHDSEAVFYCGGHFTHPNSLDRSKYFSTRSFFASIALRSFKSSQDCISPAS